MPSFGNVIYSALSDLHVLRLVQSARHGRCPIAQVLTRTSPASRQRRLITIFGAHSSTGFMVWIHAPPATRNRTDVARARRATPSISAGQSVEPVRADAYIAAAQPSPGATFQFVLPFQRIRRRD